MCMSVYKTFTAFKDPNPMPSVPLQAMASDLFPKVLPYESDEIMKAEPSFRINGSHSTYIWAININ